MSDDSEAITPYLVTPHDLVGHAQLPSGPPFRAQKLAALAVDTHAELRPEARRLDEAQILWVRDTYVPSHVTGHLLHLEGAIEAMIGKSALPEILRCHDLRSERANLGYRDSKQRERAPTFGDYEFGDVIDRATQGVHAIARRGVLRFDVRAYALPLFFALYGEESAPLAFAVFRRLDGTLHIESSRPENASERA